MNTDRPDDETADAFERFINEKLGAEALAHIKASRPPIEGKDGVLYINGRKVGGYTQGEVHDEDIIDKLTDRDRPPFHPMCRSISINIEASLIEAMRRYNDEFGAKLFGGIIPPVDTGTLRPSLTYEGLRGLYDQYLGAEAARRQKQEEEAERLRRRLLMQPNGEAFVARVDQFAQSNGVEWIDAARICSFADLNDVIANAGVEMVKAINAMFNSSAFDAFFKDMSRMVEGIKLGIDDGTITIPRNRHERRANRHKKPIKDDDQIWKRHNPRNRRNR